MNSRDTVQAIARQAEAFRVQSGTLFVLTGAGLSAESGIPTFRGRDGFWTLGSREYTPQQMATHAMFASQPEAVWRWYLYRISLCREAVPNTGHRWLATLDRELEDRFRLATQNVDGLHRLAGMTLSRLYEIHGNLRFVRCSRPCTAEVLPLPPELVQTNWPRERELDDVARQALHCPQCGGWLRPHVLWFDESYDDTYYFLTVTLEALERADWVWIIGTSGATNLPMMIARRCVQRGVPMLEMNVERTLFSKMAEATGGAVWLEPASTALARWAPHLLNDSREDKMD